MGALERVFRMTDTTCFDFFSFSFFFFFQMTIGHTFANHTGLVSPVRHFKSFFSFLQAFSNLFFVCVCVCVHAFSFVVNVPLFSFLFAWHIPSGTCTITSLPFDSELVFSELVLHHGNNYTKFLVLILLSSDIEA